MSPATWPRGNTLEERLLVIDPGSGGIADARMKDLARFLRPGDALVVNDAATLPASLRATCDAGASFEVRLLGERRDGSWSAILFDGADWRTRTEERAAPALVHSGSLLHFGEALDATVTGVSDVSARLVVLRFAVDGAALWAALYALGRPVQYAHVERPLALWHVQTAYAARPWAAEMPSAGRPLGWDLLLEALRLGVDVAALTHAAGLSATGDPALDAALPLGERFDIPSATVDAVERAKARGGRVVAVGTTVVRALEGSARAHGTLVAGEGETTLRLEAGDRLRVVDGLLTGLHDSSASHHRLVQAFAGRELVDRAYAHAERAGYVDHEFGDSSLILRAA